MYTYIHAHTQVCFYTYIYVHMCVCIYVNVNMNAHKFICICMYAYLHTYIYRGISYRYACTRTGVRMQMQMRLTIRIHLFGGQPCWGTTCRGAKLYFACPSAGSAGAALNLVAWIPSARKPSAGRKKQIEGCPAAGVGLGAVRFGMSREG